MDTLHPTATGTGPRIERCTTAVVVRRLERAPWNPRTRWNEKRITLAIVTLDDGTTGIGEAWCDGGSPDSVRAIVERDLGPLLAGRDALALRAIWHDMLETGVVSAKGGALAAAASALDIALWDAAAKVLGLPLHRLLGAGGDRVPAYASAGLYGEGKTVDDLGREMAGYVAQGFRAVKIKVGGLPIPADVDRVRAVREAIGPDVRLMVDALYAYTPDQALRFARAAAPFDLHFLEAPVHPDDLDGLRRVCANSPVPIAGNEFAWSLDTFRRLIADCGVPIVHADAILCGGVSGALRVADLAAAFHRSVSFHAASSLVCLMANAHAAAAARNAESVEVHMLHRMLFDRVERLPFTLEDGALRLGDTPGLGIVLAAGALDAEA